MPLTLSPIGVVRTDEQEIPRHWTVSQIKGRLELDAQYQEGLSDIEPGTRIVVLFHFHESPAFTARDLKQVPGRKGSKQPKGVFSICSPRRPNPIGLSILEVIDIQGTTLWVQGLDMLDGTPIIDIKPHVEDPR